MDIIGLLFRELLLMIVVFLVIFGIAAAGILTLKKSYTSSASLFVSLGREYVYQPGVGTPTGQAIPESSQVAQSEGAILNSDELKRRVIRALGIETFRKPGAAPLVGGAEAEESAAVKTMGDALTVSTAPLSGVIGLAYESDDPHLSARVLNALIDQYLVYRREVFEDTTTPLIRSQREAFQNQLEEADAAYETFLATNNIGDFATAKATLAATYSQVFAERLSLQGQLDAATRRVSTLRTQQATVPAEIAQQQDLNISAQNTILDLRTERENLLARYQPDAQPVREIEERIAQLQQYVATGTAVGARDVRIGPNQVWVDLETTRIHAQAERDSFAARLAALTRQLEEIAGRQARLTELESQNSTLAGNREVLSQAIRDFQTREAQSQAENRLASGGAENVRVIERAAPPTRGKSLKAPLLAVAFLFAGFTALCIGLLRIFTRRGFGTPASAGRTIGVPVLAVAPAKAA